jgi:hypothetical protein
MNVIIFQGVSRWFNEFKSDCVSVTDFLWLGRSATSNTHINAQCVDAFIPYQWAKKLQELSTELEISYYAILDIVHGVHYYWKVKAQSELKGLMEEYKLEHIEYCNMLLFPCTTKGTAFLNRTVTCNDHYTLECK